MTNKAYIVANEQQEREVLEKLEREGLVWYWGNTKPTEYIPSKSDTAGADFPYALINRGEGRLDWTLEIVVRKLEYDEEIVFDGRKEKQMSDKYVVSQEFMNSLNEWRENLSDFSLSENFVGPTAIDELDDIVDGWWNITDLSGEEQNSRLITILNWVNGEDVFEIEKPKKWVVRSKKHDGVNRNFYVNVSPDKTWFGTTVEKGLATQFDTKEEADKYVNSLTESVPYK